MFYNELTSLLTCGLFIYYLFTIGYFRVAACVTAAFCHVMTVTRTAADTTDMQQLCLYLLLHSTYTKTYSVARHSVVDAQTQTMGAYLYALRLRHTNARALADRV